MHVESNSSGPRAGHRTSPYQVYSPEKIHEYRAKRVRTQFGGCYMCDGIFIKADGKLTCSCMIGYRAELGDVSTDHVGRFVTGPLLSYIRESFQEGLEPFPMCGQCVCRTVKGTGMFFKDKAQAFDGLTLHVEPTNICSLFCEACLCTVERLSVNPPPRTRLSRHLFNKMLLELKDADQEVRIMVFAGYGEPLFNPDLPYMARATRQMFPASFISLDTNANFDPGLAVNLSDCGFNQIRLALDGADQLEYSAYRQNGDFNKALEFSRRLALAVKEAHSPTRVVWKYILFNHNDRDEHLKAAINLADSIGISIEFDNTVGPLASSRTENDLRLILGDHRIGINIDKEAYETIKA